MGLLEAFDVIAERIPGMTMGQIEGALGKPTSTMSATPGELSRMWMSDNLTIFMAWAPDGRMTKCGLIDPVAFPDGPVKLVDYLARRRPAVVSAVPPCWSGDPSGRHELRYWDGAQWTQHVSTQGVQSVDPI